MLNIVGMQRPKDHIIVSIGVKGRKPKINTSAITLYRDSDYIDPDNTSEDIKNLGILGGTLKKAAKGVSLKVSADNAGQEQTASIKFIIRDKDPEITGDTRMQKNIQS